MSTDRNTSTRTGGPATGRTGSQNTAPNKAMQTTWQGRVYWLLEAREGSKFDDYVLSTIILLNVAAVILETIPELRLYTPAFKAFELCSVVVFTIEYILRLWVVPFPAQHPETVPPQPAADTARAPGVNTDTEVLTSDLRWTRWSRRIRDFLVRHHSQPALIRLRYGV